METETLLREVPPGFTNEAHPEVFTKMPPQPKVKKPGQMPIEKVKQYFEEVTVTAFLKAMSAEYSTVANGFGWL